MMLKRLCLKFHGSSWNTGENINRENYNFYAHMLNE